LTKYLNFHCRVVLLFIAGVDMPAKNKKNVKQLRKGRIIPAPWLEAPQEGDFLGEGLYDSRPRCRRIIPFPQSTI
jgi:hypothetical protein